MTMKLIGGMVGALALVAGCAKFPSNGTSNITHVVFTMKVNREINPNYLYYVAFQANTSTNPDPSTGPIPVVTYPAQNGFVAGAPTHFVLFSPSLANQYTLSQFQNEDPTDTTKVDISKWSDVAIPVNYTPYTQGMNTISFEISLDQLTNGDLTKAKALKSLQVNFLTMNKVSLSTSAGRLIDALGTTTSVSTINSPVTIPLTSSSTYNNARFNYLEPSDDVISDSGHTTEPDLDIVDWSVEVRLP